MAENKSAGKAAKSDPISEKCAVCTRPIEKKTVKRMGNLYCSVYCAEINRERMENLDMDKIDFSELGDVFDRFMKTCMDCIFPLKCRKVREICSAYFDELHDYINMRWCCHAIYGLSCMLSDGSVKIDTVRHIMAKAEEIARERKCVGVSPSIMAMAEGEVIEDFTYIEFPDNPPAPPEEMHEHYLACLNCSRDFMDECIQFTQEAEKRLPEIDAMLDFPYCGHARFDMGSMLQNEKVGKEKLQQLIHKAKRIADEKGYEGGQYRIHFLAVARSVKV